MTQHRFEFGPQIETLVIPPSPVVPGTPAKQDPKVSYGGQSPVGVFNFDVEACSLSSHNRLLAVHAVFLREGQAMPTAADVAMGPDYLKFNAAAPDPEAGGRVAVDANAAPAGRYVGFSVLEFES